LAAIEAADYYWLSFAADGASDSYGGQMAACSNSKLLVTEQ
jgi:hypothetical protein